MEQLRAKRKALTRASNDSCPQKEHAGPAQSSVMCGKLSVLENIILTGKKNTEEHTCDDSSFSFKDREWWRWNKVRRDGSKWQIMEMWVIHFFFPCHFNISATKYLKISHNTVMVPSTHFLVLNFGVLVYIESRTTYSNLLDFFSFAILRTEPKGVHTELYHQSFIFGWRQGLTKWPDHPSWA